MFSGVTNSKEVIRNRMLKHALNYWNIKNTEDLDPIVKLILEALSNELYNLGNDIRDTEVRLLEKIANLLAPEFLTSPNPANSIMHALPVEPTEILSDITHFYTQKKISSKQDETLDKSIDVFFTPVARVRIANVGIAYIATGTDLYGYDPNFNKQLIVQTVNGARLESNSIWLGLSVDERISDLNNIHFQFDWKNTEQELANRNYQLLPLGKWFVNDLPVDSIEGIRYESRSDARSPERTVSIDHDLLALLEKDVKDYYERRFLSISGDAIRNVTTLKQEFPAAFKNIFPDADLQKLKSKLLWLKIVFPAGLQQGSLDELFVYTNTFPVMNRQLNELKYRLKGGSNIIPLKTSGLEQFLAVRSLSDSSHAYTATPFRKMEEEEAGTYTLRNGGVERFDGRNAKEFISYLLELLRSESAAFSAYGNDFIASTLREVDQRIALMEQKTRVLTNTSAEIPHYIIAKPFEGNDMMYAEYWVTFAEMANALRSGTRLQEYNGMKVRSDSLFLLTTTSGGKNRLKPEERVNAFRYGLMTRNRIITKEDIRNFCYYELGDRVSEVRVDKGFELSPHPQQGFLKTIDIFIKPQASERLGREGWESLFDQLKSKLQSRSGMSNHYRVFLRDH